MDEETKIALKANGIVLGVFAGMLVAGYIKSTHTELKRNRSQVGLTKCLAKSWNRVADIVAEPGSDINDVRDAMREESQFINIVLADLNM